MKIFLYIFIILPLLNFGQTTSKVIKYIYSDENFYYNLELKEDSTFIYNMGFHRGSTSSHGKWKQNTDTLNLFDYEKPFLIKDVEEKKVASLKNYALIEVIYINDTSNRRSREGKSTLYIDNKLVENLVINAPNKNFISNFKLWVNGNCNNEQETNSKGQIKISNIKIHSISFDYDTYKIKNTENNYFVLTLNTLPQPIGPPTLYWTQWIFKDNTLQPIECNKTLDYIKLKRE